MNENDERNSGSVEMSRYISIDQYDKFEQEHPFYREMVEKMIQTFRQHCQTLLRAAKREQSHHWKVLEFGAGTGLFTERIAAQPNVTVTAVEVDTECFNKLLRNMQPYGNVICLRQDSRYYKPDHDESQYDFIFSCFADHHIQDPDKLDYLKNVKGNLRQDGLYIVGEELLPPYHEKSDAERDESIKKYHGHILYLIDQIEAEAVRKAVSELESQAMESGLNRIGDFKVSAEIYAALFHGADMSSEQIKIGPADRNDVGGVYVIIGQYPRN